MENQMYYDNDPQTDNCCDLSVPFKVNCAGYLYYLDKPFVSNGNRRDWYLQIIDCGKLLNGREEAIHPGQFILRSPGTPYRYASLGEGEMGYYWLHFTGGFVQRLLNENKIPTDRVCELNPGYMPGIAHSFSRLFREFILRRPGFKDMAVSLLTDILVRLSRGILTDTPEDRESPLRQRLEQSATFIHNHFRENLCVGALAEREHLSDSRYRELFREAFGMSPGEYITHQRILYACSLLQNTDLPVIRIAEACGYQDPLYFSRIFRKKTGISPIVYRRENTDTL